MADPGQEFGANGEREAIAWV